MPRTDRRAPLIETHFRHSRFARLGIEVMSLRTLRQRVAGRGPLPPERVGFFMLLLVASGHGRHLVDFDEVPLAPGTLVFLRPGQVQQWCFDSPVEGRLILVDTPVLNPYAGRDVSRRALAQVIPDWPSHAALAPDRQRELAAAIDTLADECARFDEGAFGLALARTQLTAVLLRLARSLGAVGPAPEVQGAAAIVRQLQEALEARMDSRPSVRQLADALGYSISTLDRACLRAAGLRAKPFVDRRVALEAQRLLVHSPDTASQIGVRLGFSEATNFGKFFRRMVGCTPDQFRMRHAVATPGGSNA